MPWGSSAVLRYVQVAPLAVSASMAAEVALSPTLQDIAASVKDLQPAASSRSALLDTVADRFQRDVDSLRQAVTEIVLRLDDQDALGQRKSTEFVLNTKSEVLHRVVLGDPDTDPSLWSTRCPWRLGLVAHAARCSSKPPDAALCDKCFPQEAADQRALMLRAASSSDDDLSQCDP